MLPTVQESTMSCEMVSLDHVIIHFWDECGQYDVYLYNSFSSSMAPTFQQSPATAVSIPWLLILTKPGATQLLSGGKACRHDHWMAPHGCVTQCAGAFLNSRTAHHHIHMTASGRPRARADVTARMLPPYKNLVLDGAFKQ
jgi:hypothetical protein